MTVNELIAHLLGFPPNAEIQVPSNYLGDYLDLENVKYVEKENRVYLS